MAMPQQIETQRAHGAFSRKNRTVQVVPYTLTRERITAITEARRTHWQIVLDLNSIIRLLSVPQHSEAWVEKQAREKLSGIASGNVYFNTLLETIVEIIEENKKGEKYEIALN